MINFLSDLGEFGPVRASNNTRADVARMKRLDTKEDVTARLRREARLMSLLDRRRESTGDENWGSNIERMIVDRELGELAADICRNPGPLANQLAWVRQRERKLPSE